MEVLVEYLAKGFMVMLTVCMPCVLVAAAVGLVVGILQAVTQVQEQTIAAAPKIVPKNDSFVLPSDYYKYTKPFSAEMQDKIYTNTSQNKALLNGGKIPWDKKATKRSIYIDAKQAPAVEPNFIERARIQKNR